MRVCAVALLIICVTCYIQSDNSSNVINNGIFTKNTYYYEGWNFNSGNYLFTTDTK